MIGITICKGHSGSQSVRARVEAGRLFGDYYNNPGGIIWCLEFVAGAGRG